MDRSRLTTLFLLILLLLPAWALAQQQSADTPPPGGQTLDIQRIQERIKTYEAATDLQPDAKAELELYRSALAKLNSAEQDEALADRYKTAVDEATDQHAQLESQLRKARQQTQETEALQLQFPLGELKQQLDQALAGHRLIQSRLSGLMTEVRKERLRPDQSASELAAAKLELEEIEQKLRKSGQPVESAQHSVLLASRQALKARIKRLEMERLSYEPRQALLRLQFELVQEEFLRSELLVGKLQERINQLHAKEAEITHMETKKAEQEAVGKHPLLLQEAEYNSQLSARLGELASDIEKVLQQTEQTVAESGRIRMNRERVQQHVDIVGLDESLGELLLVQSRQLPEEKKLQLTNESQRYLLSRVRVDAFRVREQQQPLADEKALERHIDSTLRQAGLNPARDLAVKNGLQDLLRDRNNLLGKLIAEYNRYEKALSDLSFEYQQLINETGQYRKFLDRNLVWIPGVPSLRLSDLADLTAPLGWLFSAGNWSAAAKQFGQAIRHYPYRAALLLAAVIGLLLFRQRMRQELAAMAPKIGKVNQDRFRFSLLALLFTLFLALPPVLLLAGSGWLLTKGGDSDFAWIIGSTAMDVSILLLLLKGVHNLLIPKGLARVHLKWEPRTIDFFYRHLGWLTLTLVPLAFIVGITEWQLNSSFRGSLGRVANILAILVLFILAHLSFNPKSGAFKRASHRIQRALWYPLSLGIPAALFVLTVQGYLYSAIRLESLIFYSICSGILILLLLGLARRWLLIAERQLALKQALAKREAALEAKAAKEAAEGSGEGIPDAEAIEAVNLTTISEQTRRLLRVTGIVALSIMLFVLWSELIPALGWLDEIELWQYTTGNGMEARLAPVTLWDLLLGLVVVALMIVAGENLPGLLEITLLQPLQLEPGNRYAITRVSRYLIFASGVLLALSIVGVGWSDIQWLVAAMGVGLGFGLKEIFANFFSGLILLFERPIRIGDTVTMGDLSGVVSKIRIRATTITDWDNKEQVIPNQKFLTDPFVNWTLSDPITRIVIPVGIAYGSDTDKAHRIMTEVVNAHPEVLKEPKPAVFFLEFGDSALVFHVCVFVRERIRRLPLTHDLHMMLNRALKEGGIEIPFPQRDLHLRSVAPGLLPATGIHTPTDEA